MAKVKISEFSATPANNTDIDGINLAEGCAPSGINDAIRELMAQLKDWQSGTSNDPYVVGSSGSLTLSYGTANGVPYLNGSKVLTSGSALVFDGTNLGIGTSSPTSKLQIGTGAAASTVQAQILGGVTVFENAGATTSVPTITFNNDLDTGINNPGANLLAFYTGGSERMRLDTSGNVGIGTSSPGGKLEVVSSGSQSSLILRNTSAGNNTYSEILLAPFTGTTAATAYIRNVYTQNNNSVITFGTTNSSSAPTERARIDSSGNLLVGQTAAGATNSNSFGTNTSGYINVNHVNGTGSGTGYAYFGYNGGSIGSITQNGTTAVAYNTFSDYRLKENVQPMAGALAKVAALKPCTYTWKSAPDEIGEGFIAHELAEVCPQAVNGEKDAVDAEGKPVYQGIDTSFLVATLTAAIQEQQAIITALTARVTALEGQA